MQDHIFFRHSARISSGKGKFRLKPVFSSLLLLALLLTGMLTLDARHLAADPTSGAPADQAPAPQSGELTPANLEGTAETDVQNSERPTPKAETMYNARDFAEQALSIRPELKSNTAHFVFLVDITDTVGNQLINKWRNDFYIYLLNSFFVEPANGHSGDSVSVIPFTREAQLTPEVVEKLHQEFFRNKIGTLSQRFPANSNVNTPPELQKTDFELPIVQTLKLLEEKGEDRKNLVLFVLTDGELDKPEDAVSSLDDPIYDKQLGSYPNHVWRFSTKFENGTEEPRRFSVYMFSNAMTDPEATLTEAKPGQGVVNLDRQEVVNEQSNNVGPTPPTPFPTALLVIAGIVTALFLLLAVWWTDYNGGHYKVRGPGIDKVIWVRKAKNKKALLVPNMNSGDAKDILGTLQIGGKGFLRGDHLEMIPRGKYELRKQNNEAARAQKQIQIGSASDATGRSTTIYFKNPELAGNNASATTDSFGAPTSEQGLNTADLGSGISSNFEAQSLGNPPTNPWGADTESISFSSESETPSLGSYGSTSQSPIISNEASSPYEGQLDFHVTRRYGLGRNPKPKPKKTKKSPSNR